MVNRDWRPFAYGGLASIAAEFGTFPIDTTKTRLQIQGQVSDARFKEIKYKGMIHALLRISKEEGVKALYSGSPSAVLVLALCNLILEKIAQLSAIHQHIS